MSAGALVPAADPVLSVEETKAHEEGLFGADDAKAWRAMVSAGSALARAILQDYREVQAWPASPRLLVLVGKGHNGGDALIAARVLLEALPGATADVRILYDGLRPLAQRARRELQHAGGERVRWRRREAPLTAGYDVSLDGVFGFQFRPPLDAVASAALTEANRARVHLRAAVDLPSGLGDPGGFVADFTYCTGIVKQPVLDPAVAGQVGRLRYLNLHFFGPALPGGDEERVSILTQETLAPLRRLRPAWADKRHYGHLFVIGGSRSYPGAVLMAVQGALRSGVGLLTAFVPEPLAGPFAAQVPEAMWVGCPETPDGGLALEGLHLVRERASRATALLAGPGLAREGETLALVGDLLERLPLPVVLDADALQPGIIGRGRHPRILTPHAGEYARIAGSRTPRAFATETGAVVVCKGAPTRVTDGRCEHLSLAGGPVLARGGSGDILAGMIGGLLAQYPDAPLGVASAAVLWHGLAADALARARGAAAVRTTELLDHLSDALRAGLEP